MGLKRLGVSDMAMVVANMIFLIFEGVVIRDMTMPKVNKNKKEEETRNKCKKLDL